MKGKYTPGPWKVDSGRTPLGETGDYMPYVLVIGDQLPVAMMSEHFEDEETEANALLISKAPRLAELLAQVIDSSNKGTSGRLIIGYGLEEEIKEELKDLFE